MRTIIVSAADERYYPLLEGLLSSLRQWDAPLADAIGVLDVGLSPESLAALRAEVAHVVSPEWDLPVDAERRLAAPHLRAFTAPPHLPDYFPGYDLYVWIDADAWVQERNVVEVLSQAAMGGHMAVCPEVHQSYVQTYEALAWRRDKLFRCFGESAVFRLESSAYVNSGVFALRGDAAHWRYWQESSRAAFAACPEVLSDQTTLNHALWTFELPIHPLPSLYNWCCHLAIPALDVAAGKWCEPHIPHQPIGIIHMVSTSRDLTFEVDRGGETRKVSLRFGGAVSALRGT